MRFPRSERPAEVAWPQTLAACAPVIGMRASETSAERSAGAPLVPERLFFSVHQMPTLIAPPAPSSANRPFGCAPRIKKPSSIVISCSRSRDYGWRSFARRNLPLLQAPARALPRPHPLWRIRRRRLQLSRALHRASLHVA
jgi:hypothetical protein